MFEKNRPYNYQILPFSEVYKFCWILLGIFKLKVGEMSDRNDFF